MNLKKKTFEIPFIGYDYGKDNKWNFDALIGQFGNPIIGIQIKNNVEQYSADPDAYLQFHTILNQVVAIIGENHIVQKIDIFSKQTYVAEKSTEFLQHKYSEHFDGRLFKTIDTLLLFTDIVDQNNKKNTYKYSAKSYKVLRDKCLKIFMLLSQNECDPQFLKEGDLNYYINGVLSMNFSKTPSFNNIKATSEHLLIGDKSVKTISFVDVERIAVPR